MPIEFRCTGCNRLLRTADDSAGKQAKCPSCGATVPIPGPAANPFSGPGSAPFAGGAAPSAGPFGGAPATGGSVPFSGPESINPYRAPLVSDAPRAQPVPSGGWAPTRIDVGDVLSRSWRIFQDRFGLCVLVNLGFLAILFLVGAVVTGCRVGLVIGIVGGGGDPMVGNLVGFPIIFVQIAIQTWL